MYPRKLYVETTTRCNMQCGMCVKHAPGSKISDTHFDSTLFSRLVPALPTLETLVLNGIGEPLLHPDLVQMVELAGRFMSPTSSIGFQSNGLLLSEDICRRLLAAGLNQLCISVDCASCETESRHSLIHQSNGHSSPISLVRDICRQQGVDNFQLGAEIVLVRETLPHLPALVSRLAAEGVDFIIASHLLAYQKDAEKESLFTSSTIEAHKIYQKWQDQAQAEGLNLTELTAKTWIAARNDKEHRLQQLYREMLAEARDKGIWLHVKKLGNWDETEMARHAVYLAEAEDVAACYGVNISLPPLTASMDRTCRFMEDSALFVDVHGDVMPCNPLWHDYTLYMDGEGKHVTRRIFGSIIDQDILAIWQSKDCQDFRQAVLQYDYPFCHGCSLGPCPDITGDSSPFINDCFGSPVPCGYCLWCYDAVRCL